MLMKNNIQFWSWQNEEADTPSPGLTEVTFEESVPMVTYLVCFIVCDFTYKEVQVNSCTVRLEQIWHK